MKISVIGANGRTGKLVVEMALNKGWQVAAYLRNKSKLGIQHPQLSYVEGDVYDEAQIEQSVEGCDAVVSALGQSDISGEVKIMSEGMKRIIPAMQKNNVKRIVAIGGMGVLQANENMMIKDLPDFPAIYLNVSEDHHRVFQMLSSSGLLWTQVCCPYIPDGDATGNYSVRKDYMPPGKQQINTGDVADFIVKELQENNFVCSRVGIATNAQVG